jgi:hypothetical protein
MAARTLDNCRLVTAYGRPRQYDGKCEGYGTDYANDEPCEICKRCRLHYINAELDNKSSRRAL